MKCIKVVSSEPQRRVKVISKTQPKIDPEFVAEALGAKIVTEMPARPGYFGALSTLAHYLELRQRASRKAKSSGTADNRAEREDGSED